MSWTCDICGHGRGDCECGGTEILLKELIDELRQIKILILKLLEKECER